MKKNGFCRAAMAGTALFLSIAVFPSQAAETGPGFEEAVEDTYDGPESPLEAARPADKAMEAEPAKTSGGPRKPAEDASGMADGSQEAPSSKGNRDRAGGDHRSRQILWKPLRSPLTAAVKHAAAVICTPIPAQFPKKTTPSLPTWTSSPWNEAPH